MLISALEQSQAFERALPVLETASWLQPQEVRWQLTHAWCLRQTRPAPVVSNTPPVQVHTALLCVNSKITNSEQRPLMSCSTKVGRPEGSPLLRSL